MIPILKKTILLVYLTMDPENVVKVSVDHCVRSIDQK